MPDLPQLALVEIIILAGAAVQGAVGFGFSILAAPLLVLIDPRLVPGPLMAPGLTVVLLTAIRDRRGMEFRGLGWAVAGMMPGAVLGAVILSSLPPRLMGLLFAGLVLLAVVLSVGGLRLPLTRAAMAAAGFLSGLMSSTTGISGPPMALIYQHKPGLNVRGTMSGYFVASVIFTVVALNGVGRFGGEELRLGLLMVPASVAGFWLSGRMVPLLDRGYIRPAVLVMSAAAAAAVLLNG